MPDQPNQDLAAALRAAYPELDAIQSATAGEAWAVGGAVRDLLLGRGRGDNLDVVVAEDPEAVVARLGSGAVNHERFATAKLDLDGLEVDLTGARTETYARPGALPDVVPGATIEEDLARRDFSLNAIAVGLRDGRLVDPFGGVADLERRLLRVLHDGSFRDDPTRALRAARYAARLGFELEARTERLLADADLSTVSADRREAELLRIAAEDEAVRGLELARDWGLVETAEGGVELAARVDELLAVPPWSEFAPRPQALLRAAFGPAGDAPRLAAESPERPSQAVALAAGLEPIELVLARALGAEWLDRYLGEWAGVALEIDGGDLMAAGVREGPPVGAGLEAALRGKLDGELVTREQELEAALAAARACE